MRRDLHSGSDADRRESPPQERTAAGFRALNSNYSREGEIGCHG